MHGSEGQMTVAYIAYEKRKPSTRTQVDRPLQLDPQYVKWMRGVRNHLKCLVAFLCVATWMDCIKENSCVHGYSIGGVRSTGSKTALSQRSCSRMSRRSTTIAIWRRRSHRIRSFLKDRSGTCTGPTRWGPACEPIEQRFEEVNRTWNTDAGAFPTDRIEHEGRG